MDFEHPTVQVKIYSCQEFEKLFFIKNLRIGDLFINRTFSCQEVIEVKEVIAHSLLPYT